MVVPITARNLTWARMASQRGRGISAICTVKIQPPRNSGRDRGQMGGAERAQAKNRSGPSSMYGLRRTARFQSSQGTQWLLRNLHCECVEAKDNRAAVSLRPAAAQLEGVFPHF